MALRDPENKGKVNPMKTSKPSPTTQRRLLDRETIREMERFLREKQAELNGAIRSLAQRNPEAAVQPADLIDFAAETTQDEIQTSLILNHLKPQVNQIQAALERLARQEYGFCRDCGDFIGLPRLRALPFAQRCTPCQSVLERKKARMARPAMAA